MNARIHAGNFTSEALRAAVRRAHAYGVKVYLTLNTLITDRERKEYIEAALEASRAGVDALILADMGGAALLRRALPDMELHASTQMAGHNSQMAKELAAMGFTRMVAAREISREDLRRLLERSPIETELFVHGALCVSQSGECLFSSLVGGRSGNRGECAQPCRLPYSCKSCKKRGESYPLSLKDLSLASHVPELIDAGVHSFKIEGRMKSPEYVYETARIWRRLLDERRAATPEELGRMADAFSRGGFTDGYYTKKINRSMLGVRSEADKRVSREITPFGGLKRRVPISMDMQVKAGEPTRLTLSSGAHTVCVEGEIPEAARTAPLTEESVQRSLCRLGATPYAPAEVRIRLEEGLMLPVSALNELRRRATEALTDAAMPPRRTERAPTSVKPSGSRVRMRTARFYTREQITPRAEAYFERIFLPLERFASPANGVTLPPVIFDGKTEEIERQLARASKLGARYALVGNLGHLELVRRAGLLPVGDFRLNVCNSEAVARYEAAGVPSCILSPELTLGQMRDVEGDVATVVYGRIPLMTLEKCVIRELADCETCARGRASMTDRLGVVFPILREWEHRNVIYNSLPVGMSDKLARLKDCRIEHWHFLFSTETPREVNDVLRAYQSGEALPYPVRRING